MTQNKFVTRILFIFHKQLMILTIPAEWPIYMEMIQNLPMFVSHMHIVVMHITAVSSYEYRTFRTKDFSHKSFSTSFGPFAQFLVVISHNNYK